MKDLSNDMDLLNDKMPPDEGLMEKLDPIGPELQGHKWFSKEYLQRVKKWFI